MKKKNRLIKATIVMCVHVRVDRDTEPEDVFNDLSLTIDTDHGIISSKKLIHTAITDIKKLK